MRRGTLYVVATPLGHLGDLTTRAAELLRTVPVVAAEDTRRSRTLLTHLGAVRPRLVSYHAHSGPGAAAAVLRALGEGDDVALVTDAGTPGISDPGAALVAEVRAEGFAIVPLPGASAVSTALSAAGLPADRYLFLGFLPRKGAERTRLLARIAAEEWTTVLFEAPGRVRFGLDVASAAVRRDRFDFRTAPLQFPVRALARDPEATLLPTHLKTGNPPPGSPQRWDDLSWAHMQLDVADDLDVVNSAPGVTETPNYWSSDRDSASIARSFWQKPIAAVIPATRILV